MAENRNGRTRAARTETEHLQETGAAQVVGDLSVKLLAFGQEYQYPLRRSLAGPGLRADEAEVLAELLHLRLRSLGFDLKAGFMELAFYPLGCKERTSLMMVVPVSDLQENGVGKTSRKMADAATQAMYIPLYWLTRAPDNHAPIWSARGEDARPDPRVSDGIVRDKHYPNQPSVLVLHTTMGCFGACCNLGDRATEEDLLLVTALTLARLYPNDWVLLDALAQSQLQVDVPGAEAYLAADQWLETLAKQGIKSIQHWQECHQERKRQKMAAESAAVTAPEPLAETDTEVTEP